MRQKAVFLSGLLLFLSLGSITAPRRGPKSVASPMPSLSRTPALAKTVSPLAFFIGRWNCRGKFVKSGKPIASRIAFTPVLDGAWVEMRSDDVPPNRFHALEFWGFDSQSRQFKDFIFDNFAEGRLFTSPGWSGNSLVWSGDALAAQPAIAQQFDFERKSAAGFVVSWRIRKQGQDWTVGDRLTGTKSR